MRPGWQSATLTAPPRVKPSAGLADGIQATSYRAAAAVPSWPAVTSPFATREWSAAWEQVRATEHVLAASHLDVSSPGGHWVASFYLISGCGFWKLYESVAGVEPVWREPVVYAPSPYAVYGGFGLESGPEVAAVVAHGMSFARHVGAPAVVFPGLTAEQARRWLAEAPAGLQCRLEDGHRTHAVESLEAFQRSLASHDVRNEFGRQWRRGTDAGLRLRVLQGPEITRAAPEFAALAKAVGVKRNVPDLYAADLASAAAQVPGSVLLAAEHDSGMAGAFLGFLFGQKLFLWTAGIDYSRIRDLHTYGWLMAESVRYAADAGVAVIDAGRGNYRYKRRLGFTAVPLYALAYLTGPSDGAEQRLKELDRSMPVSSPATR